MKRRDEKSKGEKEKYKHLNAEFQRIARREREKENTSIEERKKVPVEK